MRGTPGNTGRTPPPGAPQPPPGEGAVVVRPPGTDARKPGDVDPCTTGLTSARARAAEVIRAALVPAPRELAVSWFAGQRDSRPERVEAYDLDALAADLRALVRSPHPKGEGAALCPAVFGDAGRDAPPDLDARRRLVNLQRSALVQLDVDGRAADAPSSAPPPTMRAAVEELRAWGVAALVWPSPSAEGPGLEVDRFRIMVQIAPDVPRGSRDRRIAPSSYAARRALVRLARWCLPGARIDEGPAVNALALAFVHPRHAPRPPGDVHLLRGRAVDLDALAALAVTAGVVPPFDASADRHREGAAYDLATLRELAAAAGLALHQGGRVTAVECPRADEHTHGGRGERGDTSCAIGPFRESWRCEHSHGGAGRLGAAELVRLALARVRDPATRERLDAELHAAEGPVARVRAQLGAAPGAGVTRLHRDDVGGFMREVGRYLRTEHAREGRAAAIVRATPGAGKSRGVADLVDACAPPPASDERESADGPPTAPRPVAVILADQRDRIPDLARALLAPSSGPRRLPVVHTPVSRVMADDGLPECTYERANGAASRIERAGGSARMVLCERGKCPRAADNDCAARDALVPHDGAGPRPSLAAELGADAPRVVIATHAAPSRPRDGGPLVIDEAHSAPWCSLEVNDRDPAPLFNAGRLARWQEGEGTADATAIVCDALHATPHALRDLEPGARLAWATDRVMEASPRTLRRIVDALAGADAPADPRERVALALDRWAGAGDGFALVPERRNHVGRVLAWRDGTVNVAPDAGEALRGVRAWLEGAPVVAVMDETGEAAGSRVTWDAPSTRAARAWFAGGGIVAHLDATADAAVARAMFGDAARWRDAAEHQRALDAAVAAARDAARAAEIARAAVTPAGRRRRARAALVPPGIPGPRVRGPASRAAARAARYVDLLVAFAPPVEGPPPAARVFDARLPDLRDAARVIIADTRSTSRSQFKARTAAAVAIVRWDRIGAQLAAVAARIEAWRAPRPGVEVLGAGIARQRIARALAAFWGLDAAGGDLDAAARAACSDLRSDDLTAADVARELAALLNDPRALQRAADLRALAPRFRWTYPGHALARGSNELRACSVFVALGDFRPTPAEAAAVAARTGRSAEHEAARLAGDVAVQWFGRARVAQGGPPALLVHVGELAPPDWCGVGGVEVIAAGEGATVTSSARAPTAPRPSPAAAADDASQGAPVDTPAARAVGALLAAGWTATDLARRLAAVLGGRSAESIARTLRRWRAGGDAGDAALLAAVVDLAREARDPADALRARVVYLARGRGAARVWSGARGVPGLRAFADRFGDDVTAADLAAFAGGAERPAVVALLLRDVAPGAPVVAALEAAHGIAPPPPLTSSAPSSARARAVAEGTVEGSAWQRGDALRLRPGVARPPAAPPAPPPLAPPLPAPAAATGDAARRKGAPPP